MAAFQFYALTSEQGEALRADRQAGKMLLLLSVSLAEKLARVAGIYTPLAAEDENILQGVHTVVQVYAGYVYEGELDVLCQLAGLCPSDLGLLSERIETLYREREPIVAEAEMIMLLEQWLAEQKK